MPALGGKQPGDGVEGGGLAGTVRAEHGHDLAGLGGECDVEGETVTVDEDPRVEAHRTHRPRSAPRMTTDTTSMARLSEIAASGSRSRAT